MLNFPWRIPFALAVVVVAIAAESHTMYAEAPPATAESAFRRGAGAQASTPVLLAGGSTFDPALPDSLGFSTSAWEDGQAVPPPTPAPVAPLKFIVKAGETAPPLTAANKFHFATASALSPLRFAGSLASAGISQATDSRPHFGTDSAAYGERLGATVYRTDVKAFFGFGVFPVLFHDDPRYYVLGDAAPLRRRVLYAATRIVVARKDNGGRGINYPRLLAPVVSQGSANGFYPGQDQDARKTITGILVSYAASAASDELREFRGDLLRRLHRNR